MQEGKKSQNETRTLDCAIADPDSGTDSSNLLCDTRDLPLELRFIICKSRALNETVFKFNSSFKTFLDSLYIKWNF